MKDPYELFQKYILPNGLHVWHLYQERPFACFEFVVHAGSREDPVGKEGLAHFNEHLVSRNAPDYPNYSKTKKWFEDIGGVAAFGSTSFMATTYDCKVPLENMSEALNIFGSILVRSSITSAVEEQRNVIQREYLRRYATQISFEIAYHGQRDFFPFHRSTHSTPLGIPKSIDAITHEDLKTFHARYYCPQNITLVCVGGVDLETLLSCIQISPFGDTKNGVDNRQVISLHEPVVPTLRQKTVRMSEYSKVEVNQSVVRRTIALPSTTSKSVIKGLVSVIKRELTDEIRENKSLTYHVSVSSQYSEGIKFITVETSVPPDAVENVNKAITNCINGLVLKEQEFIAEKSFIANQFKIHDVTLGKIADSAAWDVIYHGKVITLRAELTQLEKLRWSDFHGTATVMLEDTRNMSLFIIP